MPLHRIHATAGGLAFILIAAFWLSTVATELSGAAGAIAWTKSAILWAMLVLVPSLVTAGATGFRLGGKMRLPEAVAKKRRMPFIAANGLLVLLPSAFFLNGKAATANFDTSFFAVQALELCAGLVNLVLLGLNIRDGIAISARRRRAASRPVPSVFRKAC